MAKKPASEKQIESFVHDDASRRNIPPAEFQTMVRNQEKTPIQVAYERRNPDLDPQLIWRGKDLLDESQLVVNAPPLYIQEKIHPKVLIDDLKRRSKEDSTAQVEQIDLFAAFNGLPSEEAKTEFYQHDQNWSNRMILGDSLQVMASLAEREGLRGKVQCIYFDPPYGIKFNSNFQWSTTSRDVKDGKTDQITREPEQVKAFRDTWRDGVHSYMTYIRDRLFAASELLTPTGSIFLQIGDENVHRIRAVMDEVFGESNFASQVSVSKTSGLGGMFLAGTQDFILWYTKNKDIAKFRRLYVGKMARAEADSHYQKDLDGNLFTLSDLSGQFSNTPSCMYSFNYAGREYSAPKGRQWKTTLQGMNRLARAGRIQSSGNSIRYKRYATDLAALPITDVWSDVAGSVQSRNDPKVYVVQTGVSVVQRCILMATDPGDLVLDPTCGSGTSATAAEQWGRRWITIDTSRVALVLARARIMGARYPFYLLADSREGQAKEFLITQLDPQAS
jgi:adenine-specific DNA-methyltransferase